MSFDLTQIATEVRAFMERREFDVVGVREHGMGTGYVVRHELESDVIGRHRRAFVSGDILPDSKPLLSAFAALRGTDMFSSPSLGMWGGIVTWSDLQKAPVRLWLFGAGIPAGDANAARGAGALAGR